MADNVQLNIQFNDNGAPVSVENLERSVEALQAAVANLGRNFSTTTATVNTGTSQMASGLNKVATAHAGVNRELLVLAHEVATGNWSRFGGSLLVLGERTDALGTAMRALSSLGVGVGATLGLLVGAAVAVGAAFIQAGNEQKAFNNSLIESGNYAGLTAGKFKELTNVLENQTSAGFGKTREAIDALASSGRFTAEQIAKLEPVIIALSRVTGQSIEEVSKRFTELGDNPKKFFDSLDKSMHVLSADQISLISRLEEQGKVQEAVNVGIQAWTGWLDTNKTKLADNVGWFNKLSDSISRMWNSFKSGIGANPKTIDDQIASLQGALKTYAAFPATVAAIQENINRLVAQRDKLNAGASDEATKASINAQVHAASDFLDRLGVKTTQTLTDALARFQAAFDTLKKNSPNDPRVTDPNFYKNARDKVIEQNQDPEVARQRKQRFEQQLTDLSAQSRLLSEGYKEQTDLIKVQLDKGNIDEEQAAQQLRDIHIKEIEDQKALLQQKADIATKEALATNGKDGVNQRREALAEIQVLNGQEKVINAQWEAEITRHERAIDGLYARVNETIQRGNAARAKQVQEELNRIGLSQNEALLADAEASVKERFDNLRERVLTEYKAKGATDAETNAALQLVNNQEQVQLAQEKEYFKQRQSALQDWSTEAKKDLKDYIDSVTSAANQMRTLIDSITKNFENGIFELLQTGSINFRKLGDNFKSTIDRMVAQALNAQLIKALFGNFLSGGSSTGAVGGLFSWVGSLFGGGKAGGGPLDTGKWYIAGEKGPEPIWGGGPGAFAAGYNNAAPTPAGTTNIHIHATDADSFRGLLAKDGQFITTLVSNTQRAFNIG